MIDATSSARGRIAVALLTGVGAAAAVALVVLVAYTGDGSVLLPSAIPLAFLLAGTLGAVARPDHRGLRLLLAVGTTHLAAFATTGWVSAGRHPSGWWAWSFAVVGDGAFLAGFVLLALLLASYPTGRLDSRGLRAFAAFGSVVASVAILVEALLHARLGLALNTTVDAIPAPAPLPLVQDGPSLVGFVPGLVVVGAIVLFRRARGFTGDERRAVRWAALAGGVLALLLLATPAANTVLSDAAWGAVFVSVVSAVPFVLLAGLSRFRLLEVDLYVVRTLSRGVLAVLVLTAFAAGEAVLGHRGFVVASVVLTVLAAMTGARIVRSLEGLVDRAFTRGSVRRRAVLDELIGALREPGHDHSDNQSGQSGGLAERICRSVATALDVSWVRLVLDGRTAAVVGLPADAEAAVAVPLSTGGATDGLLECGPRRGGWSAIERAQLDAITTPTTLALREATLTRELSARVAELTASRTRLVQVEQQVRVQIERDLHDGVQQQLVALLARLAVLREYLTDEQLDDASPAGAALVAAHELAGQSLRDLRTLVSGLHPVLLSDRGLVAAVQARADLAPIAVAVDADPRIAGRRFPLEVEGAAFFVVSEALANVLKHSGSAHARVVIAPHDGGLRVAVTDEGSGAATYTGSGLRGLRDRVEALGGRFDLQATLDVGTTVVADFVVDVPVAARV